MSFLKKLVKKAAKSASTGESSEVKVLVSKISSVLLRMASGEKNAKGYASAWLRSVGTQVKRILGIEGVGQQLLALVEDLEGVSHSSNLPSSREAILAGEKVSLGVLLSADAAPVFSKSNEVDPRQLATMDNETTLYILLKVLQTLGVNENGEVLVKSELLKDEDFQQLEDYFKEEMASAGHDPELLQAAEAAEDKISQLAGSLTNGASLTDAAAQAGIHFNFNDNGEALHGEVGETIDDLRGKEQDHSMASYRATSLNSLKNMNIDGGLHGMIKRKGELDKKFGMESITELKEKLLEAQSGGDAALVDAIQAKIEEHEQNTEALVSSGQERTPQDHEDFKTLNDVLGSAIGRSQLELRNNSRSEELKEINRINRAFNLKGTFDRSGGFSSAASDLPFNPHGDFATFLRNKAQGTRKIGEIALSNGDVEGVGEVMAREYMEHVSELVGRESTKTLNNASKEYSKSISVLQKQLEDLGGSDKPNSKMGRLHLDKIHASKNLAVAIATLKSYSATGTSATSKALEVDKVLAQTSSSIATVSMSNHLQNIISLSEAVEDLLDSQKAGAGSDSLNKAINVIPGMESEIARKKNELNKIKESLVSTLNEKLSTLNVTIAPIDSELSFDDLEEATRKQMAAVVAADTGSEKEREYLGIGEKPYLAPESKQYPGIEFLRADAFQLGEKLDQYIGEGDLSPAIGKLLAGLNDSKQLGEITANWKLKTSSEVKEPLTFSAVGASVNDSILAVQKQLSDMVGKSLIELNSENEDNAYNFQEVLDSLFKAKVEGENSTVPVVVLNNERYGAWHFSSKEGKLEGLKDAENLSTGYDLYDQVQQPNKAGTGNKGLAKLLTNALSDESTSETIRKGLSLKEAEGFIDTLSGYARSLESASFVLNSFVGLQDNPEAVIELDKNKSKLILTLKKAEELARECLVHLDKISRVSLKGNLREALPREGIDTSIVDQDKANLSREISKASQAYGKSLEKLIKLYYNSFGKDFAVVDTALARSKKAAFSLPSEGEMDEIDAKPFTEELQGYLTTELLIPEESAKRLAAEYKGHRNQTEIRDFLTEKLSDTFVEKYSKELLGHIEGIAKSSLASFKKRTYNPERVTPEEQRYTHESLSKYEEVSTEAVASIAQLLSSMVTKQTCLNPSIIISRLANLLEGVNKRSEGLSGVRFSVFDIGEYKEYSSFLFVKVIIPSLLASRGNRVDRGILKFTNVDRVLYSPLDSGQVDSAKETLKRRLGIQHGVQTISSFSSVPVESQEVAPLSKNKRFIAALDSMKEEDRVSTLSKLFKDCLAYSDKYSKLQIAAPSGLMLEAGVTSIDLAQEIVQSKMSLPTGKKSFRFWKDNSYGLVVDGTLKNSIEALASLQPTDDKGNVDLTRIIEANDAIKGSNKRVFPTLDGFFAYKDEASVPRLLKEIGMDKLYKVLCDCKKDNKLNSAGIISTLEKSLTGTYEIPTKPLEDDSGSYKTRGKVNKEEVWVPSLKASRYQEWVDLTDFMVSWAEMKGSTIILPTRKDLVATKKPDSYDKNNLGNAFNWHPYTLIEPPLFTNETEGPLYMIVAEELHVSTTTNRDITNPAPEKNSADILSALKSYDDTTPSSEMEEALLEITESYQSGETPNWDQTPVNSIFPSSPSNVELLDDHILAVSMDIKANSGGGDGQYKGLAEGLASEISSLEVELKTPVSTTVEVALDEVRAKASALSEAILQMTSKVEGIEGEKMPGTERIGTIEITREKLGASHITTDIEAALVLAKEVSKAVEASNATQVTIDDQGKTRHTALERTQSRAITIIKKSLMNIGSEIVGEAYTEKSLLMHNLASLHTYATDLAKPADNIKNERLVYLKSLQAVLLASNRREPKAIEDLSVITGLESLSKMIKSVADKSTWTRAYSCALRRAIEESSEDSRLLEMDKAVILAKAAGKATTQAINLSTVHNSALFENQEAVNSTVTNLIQAMRARALSSDTSVTDKWLKDNGLSYGELLDVFKPLASVKERLNRTDRKPVLSDNDIELIAKGNDRQLEIMKTKLVSKAPQIQVAFLEASRQKYLYKKPSESIEEIYGRAKLEPNLAVQGVKDDAFHEIMKKLSDSFRKDLLSMEEAIGKVGGQDLHYLFKKIKPGKFAKGHDAFDMPTQEYKSIQQVLLPLVNSSEAMTTRILRMDSFFSRTKAALSALGLGNLEMSLQGAKNRLSVAKEYMEKLDILELIGKSVSDSEVLEKALDDSSLDQKSLASRASEVLGIKFSEGGDLEQLKSAISEAVNGPQFHGRIEHVISLYTQQVQEAISQVRVLQDLHDNLTSKLEQVGMEQAAAASHAESSKKALLDHAEKKIKSLNMEKAKIDKDPSNTAPEKAALKAALDKRIKNLEDSKERIEDGEISLGESSVGPAHRLAMFNRYITQAVYDFLRMVSSSHNRGNTMLDFGLSEYTAEEFEKSMKETTGNLTVNSHISGIINGLNENIKVFSRLKKELVGFGKAKNDMTAPQRRLVHTLEQDMDILNDYRGKLYGSVWQFRCLQGMSSGLKKGLLSGGAVVKFAKSNVVDIEDLDERSGDLEKDAIESSKEIISQLHKEFQQVEVEIEKKEKTSEKAAKTKPNPKVKEIQVKYQNIFRSADDNQVRLGEKVFKWSQEGVPNMDLVMALLEEFGETARHEHRTAFSRELYHPLIDNYFIKLAMSAYNED